MPLFSTVWNALGIVGAGIGNACNAIWVGLGQIGVTTSQVLSTVGKSIGL